MTLCDNGLLTYHPSLHVSPWGPGPGQSRRGGRADSSTEGRGSGGFALQKGPRGGGWGAAQTAGHTPGPSARLQSSELWLNPSEHAQPRDGCLLARPPRAVNVYVLHAPCLKN